MWMSSRPTEAPANMYIAIHIKIYVSGNFDARKFAAGKFAARNFAARNFAARNFRGIFRHKDILFLNFSRF